MQSKPPAAVYNTQLCHPVNHHWNVCALLRYLSLMQVNLSGTEIVTHWRTVQVSWREAAEPEVPQRPPTPLSKTRTVGPIT